MAIQMYSTFNIMHAYRSKRKGEEKKKGTVNTVDELDCRHDLH